MIALILVFILAHPIVQLPAGTVIKDVGRNDIVLSPAFRDRPVFVPKLNVWYSPKDGLTPKDWEAYPLLIGMLIKVRTTEIPIDPWGPFTGNELIVGFYEKPRSGDGICPQMQGYTGYQEYPEFFTGVLCPVIHLDTGTAWDTEIGEYEYMLVSDPDGYDDYPISSCTPNWPVAQMTPWGEVAQKDVAIKKLLGGR